MPWLDDAASVGGVEVVAFVGAWHAWLGRLGAGAVAGNATWLCG